MRLWFPQFIGIVTFDVSDQGSLTSAAFFLDFLGFSIHVLPKAVPDDDEAELTLSLSLSEYLLSGAESMRGDSWGDVSQSSRDENPSIRDVDLSAIGPSPSLREAVVGLGLTAAGLRHSTASLSLNTLVVKDSSGSSGEGSAGTSPHLGLELDGDQGIGGPPVTAFSPPPAGPSRYDAGFTGISPISMRGDGTPSVMRSGLSGSVSRILRRALHPLSRLRGGGRGRKQLLTSPIGGGHDVYAPVVDVLAPTPGKVLISARVVSDENPVVSSTVAAPSVFDPPPSPAAFKGIQATGVCYKATSTRPNAIRRLFGSSRATNRADGPRRPSFTCL